MRLLYLCSDFGIDPAGSKGASIHVRAITRALAGLGHEMLFLSPKGAPGGDHPATAVLPAGCPPVEKTGKLLKRWLNERELGDSVAREFRPLMYNAWVREPAQQALRDLRPDAIMERLSLFGHVGVDLADELNVPLILEVNAPLTDEATRYRSLEMVGLAERIERRVLDRADAITTVSSELAGRLASDGVAPGKIHVVPNGADIGAFNGLPGRDACRAALNLKDEFAIGFVGSLKPWHGVDVLLEAFAQVQVSEPDARLFVVGTGPGEDALREQAHRSNLGRSVTFTGALPHERIPALLRAMDVSVAPFRDTPGFYFSPIKLFEYMAAENCIIASHLGQIVDVIEDGVTGLLCKPDDPNDLAAALNRARKSPSLRRTLGVAAAKEARTQYSWERAARDVARVVAGVIDQRPNRECAVPTRVSA